MDLIDECRIVGQEQIKGCRTDISGPCWLCDDLIQKVVFGNIQQLLALGSMQMVGFDRLLNQFNISQIQIFPSHRLSPLCVGIRDM